MLHKLYARWMYRWETALTTRDENRIVRPLEWGFDWLKDYTDHHPPAADPASPTASPAGVPGSDQTLSRREAIAGPDYAHTRHAASTTAAAVLQPELEAPLPASQADRHAGEPEAPRVTGPRQGSASLCAEPGLPAARFKPALRAKPHLAGAPSSPQSAMLAINQAILADSDSFFNYTPPSDYRLEQRHPQLFPTNVRPETLAQAADLEARAERGTLPKAEFLRFTSPVRTPHPENDLVNARWYPAPPDPQTGAQPRKAIIVMPQWNADAFSHNALCSLFNRFGVSALRLSKPYHDIRRPAELERSDYAVSSNIGRTLAACQQAVVDIRCCLDWLEAQGYQQFGVLGTSLGSCYAFLAAAHDERLEVCAFNHASTSFGDVVWTGQSTRHIRAAFEAAGLSQLSLNALWGAISPVHYMQRYKETAARRNRRTLVIHATYDLTFLEEFSIEVLRNFNALGIPYESKVLPCGHYTTGETPYKFLDGWYLGSFVYQAFS